MIKVYPYSELGHADHGWLDARHHFSFASYYNPDRHQFGTLRVINDDRIAAGAGFGTHPHNNMEIITYVRSGAISHRDSMGNEGRTVAGDVQVMSAGAGVTHSEFNQEKVDTTLYQIWITPNARDVKPRWETETFPKEPVENELALLVSGYAEDKDKGALYIHQNATIHGGRLKQGTSLNHPIRRQAYILASQGSIQVGDQVLQQGDGAEVTDMSSLPITALSDAELLVIDVPVA